VQKVFKNLSFFGALLFLAPLHAETTPTKAWSNSLESYIQERQREPSPNFQYAETEVLIFPGINSEFEKEDSFKELENIVAESNGKLTLDIHWPNSLEPAEDNALTLVDFLEEKIATWTPNDPKLLLLGHSKGGLELFLACLLRPDICNSEAVSLVTILQAPIMGTQTADELFSSKGEPLKIFSFLFFFMPSVNSEVVLGEGMKSVRTQAVLDLYKSFDMKVLNEKLKKIVFIAGAEKVKDWSKELKVPNRSFEGDGIIPLVQARHKEFTVAPSYSLSCDHLDIVIRSPRSNKGEAYRNLFWKSLLSLRESLLNQEI